MLYLFLPCIFHVPSIPYPSILLPSFWIAILINICFETLEKIEMWIIVKTVIILQNNGDFCIQTRLRDICIHDTRFLMSPTLLLWYEDAGNQNLLTRKQNTRR